jgi:hypothetical protein
MEKDKCNSIYWNLLELLDKFDSLDSTNYIRELMETNRCDKYNNLSQLRQDVRTHIGEESFLRIIREKKYSNDINTYQIEKQEDEERANGTLMHYHYWHRKNLAKCLPFHFRIYYETVFQTGRFGLFLGLFGGTAGAYKWVKKFPKKNMIIKIKNE